MTNGMWHGARSVVRRGCAAAVIGGAWSRGVARGVAVLAVGAMCGASPAPAHAQALTFTYQGQLSDDGQPANGVYDFRFSLFNQASGGSAISSTHCANDVTVTDGLFTVELPLVIPPPESGAFLNITVRSGALGTCSNTSGFQLLTPRQPLNRAPSATYAAAIADDAPAITGALRFNQALGRAELFDGTFWNTLATVNSSTVIAPSAGSAFVLPGTYTFTVPAGVTSLYVQMSGGGGGGGGLGPGSTSLPGFCATGILNYAAGGGGGSSGASASFLLDVTPGEDLTIIVGDGGVGGFNTPGIAGQPSRIRRGALDVVTVPGGNPGGRTNSIVAIAPDPTPNACTGVIGGLGGPAAPAPTLSGPGRLIAIYAGGAGTPGRGPSCAGAFDPTFCIARGGQGGAPNATLFNQGAAGGGGDGAGANIIASNGQAGRVYLRWYAQ